MFLSSLFLEMELGVSRQLSAISHCRRFWLLAADQLNNNNILVHYGLIHDSSIGQELSTLEQSPEG